MLISEWACTARFASLLGMADFTSVCSLEYETLKELDLGYVLAIHKLKNISRDVNPVFKELSNNWASSHDLLEP